MPVATAPLRAGFVVVLCDIDSQYLSSSVFLIIGIAANRCVARKGASLPEVHAEGNSRRKRSRFLLGAA
jgi:hypothetical protein